MNLEDGARSTRIDRSAAPVPGFGAACAGRAVILRDPMSGTDVPVLIAEMPSMPGNGANSEPVDYRIEMARTAGMLPQLDLPARPAHMAGWSARRRDAQQVDIVAGAHVFVTIRAHLPRRWLNLAATRSDIVVVCGVDVLSDVQTPVPEAFTTGRAVAGRIVWHPKVGQTPGYHLLDLRGMGMALPVFAFPADELKIRGEMGSCNFEYLGGRDPGRPLPVSRRLVWSASTRAPPTLTFSR